MSSFHPRTFSEPALADAAPGLFVLTRALTGDDDSRSVQVQNVTNAQDFLHIIRTYVERELESRGFEIHRSEQAFADASVIQQLR